MNDIEETRNTFNLKPYAIFENPTFTFARKVTSNFQKVELFKPAFSKDQTHIFKTQTRSFAKPPGIIKKPNLVLRQFIGSFTASVIIAIHHTVFMDVAAVNLGCSLNVTLNSPNKHKKFKDISKENSGFESYQLTSGNGDC